LLFFKVKILLNKTGSHLDGPCSSPDSNLKSGEEQYVYRTLIVRILDISVAKGPKFRPQNTKGAEKSSEGPERSGAELLSDLAKKGRKGAELF
jgi:hypothetical protein